MAKEGRYIYRWPRPMVTADAMVFSVYEGKTKILLIERGNEPFKGKWAVPGGFVEIDEELADAAKRELFEETGLTEVTLQQMHTFGTCGRDPRGRQITIVFMAVIDRPVQVKGGDDACDARWFDINDLPELAFDHHDVVKMGIEKLPPT